MKDRSNKTFPSIYAKMGDRPYFVTTMTFNDIAEWLIPPREVEASEELKDWIQRKRDDKRLSDISNYLLKQDQHFFNAIVAGIFQGEPEWYPVVVTESPTLRAMNITIDERSKDAIGILRLQGDEQIFAIDGQHRVDGIKAAIAQNPEIGKEELSVIFVGHKSGSDGEERTRRLFTTLNRYARPVSKGEIIALDQDDAFAIITRRLIYNYDPLKLDKFTTFTKTTNLPSNDSFAITTVLALYDLVKTLGVSKTSAGSRQRSQLIIGPPEEAKIESIYELITNFWDLLIKYIKPIKAVTIGHVSASSYRDDRGGHLLFRPNGLMVFTTAVRVLLDRKEDLEAIIQTISMLPLELNEEPWRYVLWNPDEEKVITNQKTLATNLLLYMVDNDPSPINYKLEERYQKVLGDSEATLKNLPVYEI